MIMIELLVLGAVALFLILKLRSVLGTREGFEKPPIPLEPAARPRRDFEVISGGADSDITDHTTDGSPAAKALAAMKGVEPAFSVTTFLAGARGAYEMILLAFERGDIEAIRPFIEADIEAAFDEAIADRKAKGLTVEAQFVGLKELTLQDATFDSMTKRAEITVRFVGELTTVVRDAKGEIVEGSAKEIKRQRDVWTFARSMGAADPNWQLSATGD